MQIKYCNTLVIYMKKISWCKQQEKGIKLVEPNENVSQEYFKSTEESMQVLRSIQKTQSNMWLATTKYYIEYFAVYAVLMKIGIKCEIHDCTITLISWLEQEKIFPKGTSGIVNYLGLKPEASDAFSVNN